MKPTFYGTLPAMFTAAVFTLPAPPAAMAQAEAPATPTATATAPTVNANRKATARPKKKVPREAPIDPYAPTPSKPPRGAKQAESTIDPYAQGTPNVDPLPNPYFQPVVPARLTVADVPSLQGLLAVENVQGWLIGGRAQSSGNANRLLFGDTNVAAANPWFWFLPAKGEPTAVCHVEDCGLFGEATLVPYQAPSELSAALKKLLLNKKRIAVEADSLTTSQAAALTKQGKQLRSASTLLEYTVALWGEAGKASHLVAAHHIGELRKATLRWLAEKLANGQTVTELDAQAHLQSGMVLRGVVGPAPSVAFGPHTAIANFRPTPANNFTLGKGDLVVISLAVKLAKPGSVFAAASWVAVAATQASPAQQGAFGFAVTARSKALELLGQVTGKQRVQASSVDAALRELYKAQNQDRAWRHATGFGLDHDLRGQAAPLDSAGADRRALLLGTGYAIGPGWYQDGAFGLRTMVSAYLGANGVEVTTPPQTQIEPLLKP